MYQIRYATEADVPALNKVNVLSFQTRRSRAAIFPNADVSTLQDYKGLNCMKQLANPYMHVVAITDPDSFSVAETEIETEKVDQDQNNGQNNIDIVAYARWFIPKCLGYPPHICTLSPHGKELALAAENPLDHAPRPMNEALYFASREIFQDVRKRHATERDIDEGPCENNIRSESYMKRPIN